MYAVVGCTDCTALWVVSGRPETTSCPRCGTRRQFVKLKKFVETETAEAAKNVRSTMIQRRAGDDQDLEDFATLEEQAMASGIDEADFLAASGVDADAVAAASARAEASSSGESLSKRAAVERAVEELERPTEPEIVAFAANHGVERDYVERALAKLQQAGALTETSGRYRSL